MKSNNVKYIIAILWITALFTSISSVNAFWIRPNPAKVCHFTSDSWVFPNCTIASSYTFSTSFEPISTDYSDLNDLNYYYYDAYSSLAWRYYTLSTWDHISNWYLKSYNDWDILNYTYKTNLGTRITFQYNFINVQMDWSAPVYYWWYDFWKKYNSVNYSSLPSLPNIDWSWDYFYFSQPWHGTWIFYNFLYDKKLKTIQYIWNKALTNKIIYVDTLAKNDNVWLIDVDKMSAWSYTEDDVNILSSLLFWEITDNDLLEGLPWSDYYNVSYNVWWNSFLPPTYWNFTVSPSVYNDANNKWLKSSAVANIWLSYNKNYDFVWPNFWWGGNNNNWSGDLVNNKAYKDYVQCRDTYTNVKTWANSEYLCRQDANNWLISFNYFTWLFHDIYNYVDWIEDIVAQTDNCQRWLDYSIMAYYDTSLWNEDLSTYQNYLLISDRNSWELNMLDISNYCTYDITSVNGSSSVNTKKNETCWRCAWWLFWDDLCEEKCVDSWESISQMIQRETYEKTIGVFNFVWEPIRFNYYSWYNTIQEKFWLKTCEKDIYNKSFAFANALVYLVVISILFSLFVAL